MPAFEFTLFLDGVDVLSEETQDQLARLPVPMPAGDDAGRAIRALPYRGGDFFANALFGREGEVQYATFRLEAPSEDVAMQWAAAMLVQALSDVCVARAVTGRYGSVEIL